MLVNTHFSVAFDTTGSQSISRHGRHQRPIRFSVGASRSSPPRPPRWWCRISQLRHRGRGCETSVLPCSDASWQPPTLTTPARSRSPAAIPSATSQAPNFHEARTRDICSIWYTGATLKTAAFSRSSDRHHSHPSINRATESGIRSCQPLRRT